MLQSETGYIDARPLTPARRNLLQRTAGPYKLRRAQCEHMFSALPSNMASLCPAKHDSRVRGLIALHLPIGPVFEIADRELFEEWIGIDELFSRCPAARVSARHECSRVGIFRNGQDGHGSRGNEDR